MRIIGYFLAWITLAASVAGGPPALGLQTYTALFDNRRPQPEAIADYVRTHPDLYLPYLSLAGLLADTRQPEKQLEHQLIAWFPDTPYQAAFVKGLLARIRGYSDTARTWFSRMEQIPDSPLIVGQLLRMSTGSADRIFDRITPADSFSPDMETVLRQVYAERKSPASCQASISALFHALPSYSKPDYVAFIIYNYLYLQSVKQMPPASILDAWRQSPGPDLVRRYPPYIVIFNQLLFRVETSRLRPDRARDLVLAGLNVAERFRFIRTRRLYRRWLAELEARQGKVPEAVRILKAELTDVARLGDDWDRMNLLSTIAQIYLDNGMAELALPFLEDAMPLFQQKNRRQYPYILSLASNASRQLGDLERAIRWAKKGIRVAESEGIPIYSVLNAQQLARSLVSSGDIRGGIRIAESFLDRASAVTPSQRASLLFTLVSGYEAAGNRCRALQLAREAVALQLPPAYAMKAHLRLYQLMTGNPCRALPLGPFDIFRRIRHIHAAVRLSNQIDVNGFQSLQERYDFLSASVTAYRSYADAMGKLARAVILLAVLLVCVTGLLWISYLLWARRRQSLIGPYRLKEKVGEGGMGEVYRAVSLEDRREVALKILKTPVSGSPARVKQFKDETMILKRLDHPNILRYYDSGEHKGRLFLATEFLNGKTLQQKLEEEWPLSMDLSLYIVGEVLNGLRYLHDREVLHRDIKPGNIMIADLKFTLTHPTGRMGRIVKLMDFGIAKQLGTESQTQGIEVAGTPAYIAPETLTMNKTTVQTDIYALGVTLYRLFAGVLPYTHPEPMVVQQQILNPVFTPQSPRFMRKDLPDCLETIIMRCIEKSPKKRYPNVDAVQADFQACLASVRHRASRA